LHFHVLTISVGLGRQLRVTPAIGAGLPITFGEVEVEEVVVFGEPKMSTHKQTWTKVNAPVDHKIAPLVDVLSLFPKLQTIESCQKVSNAGDAPAWVSFLYGDYWDDPWLPLASFLLGYLGPRLMQEVGDRAHVSIQVCDGHVQGELAVQPSALPVVIKAIRKLSKDFGN
jgi:hypothetical protein